MNQTRVQRHYRKKAFYQRNWFWLMILTGVLLVGFVSNHYWVQDQTTHTTQTTLKRSKKNINQSKLQKNMDRFQKNHYTTQSFVLTLTGGKITADQDSKPVLLIEYHFKNLSDTDLTPHTIWTNYAQIMQQKDELTITKNLMAGLPEQDQTLIQATQHPVASGQTCEGAIAFTLVDKKNITLTFLDTKTHKPLGTKQYKLTE